MEKSMKLKKIKYLWLDGYETPNIRCKTRYVEIENEVSLETIPEWGFDGSSTKQADGDDSDCILQPVKIYKNPLKGIDGYSPCCNYLVLCEVVNTDGTPHKTNTRAKLREVIGDDTEEDFLFGIEQEYVMIDPKTQRPVGWPDLGYPPPQGRYYCGIGSDVVRNRKLIDHHAWVCIAAGIPFEGTNAEVMMSQYEYQIGTANALDICDDLWMSRFLLEMLAESENIAITLDPKPIKGDWNGSGAHINFSTKRMREVKSQDYFVELLKEFEKTHKEHIIEYGFGNEERLTGHHETQHIDNFSWGVADRGASIRVPLTTNRNDMGHLEDRRPASNMDPYRAIARLVKTIDKVDANTVED